MPLLIAAVCYCACVAVWQFAVVPEFPPRVFQSGSSDGPIVWIDSIGSFKSQGHVEGASSLVVGDSRTKDAIHLDVLADGGIENPAVLWAAAVPLTRILPAAEELSPRNLIVCLSALSLAAESDDLLTAVFRGESPPMGDSTTQDEFDSWKERRAEELLLDGFERSEVIGFFKEFTRLSRQYAERRAWTPRAIDTRLGEWLDSKRMDTLRVTQPQYWLISWFYRTDLHRSDATYKSMAESFVASEWSPIREQIIAKLISIRESGMNVVCVRLPLSPNLLAFEEQAVKSEEFEELCDRAGVSYFDYSTGPYSTHDGSHLTFESAERFNVQLARDAMTVFGE